MSLLALMETIDKTNGQTASFALQFKDGANKALTLTGDGKGKPVEAKVTNGMILSYHLSLLHSPFPLPFLSNN